MEVLVELPKDAAEQIIAGHPFAIRLEHNVALALLAGKTLSVKLDNPVPFKAPSLSGDACRDCGQFALVRSGTCLTCQNCGATTGCS